MIIHYVEVRNRSFPVRLPLRVVPFSMLLQPLTALRHRDPRNHWVKRACAILEGPRG